MCLEACSGVGGSQYEGVRWGAGQVTATGCVWEGGTSKGGGSWRGVLRSDPQGHPHSENNEPGKHSEAAGGGLCWRAGTLVGLGSKAAQGKLSQGWSLRGHRGGCEQKGSQVCTPFPWVQRDLARGVHRSNQVWDGSVFSHTHLETRTGGPGPSRRAPWTLVGLHGDCFAGYVTVPGYPVCCW